MKSLLRENRIPKGSKAKVARIVADLAANPPGQSLTNASGAKIFALWKASRGQGRR